MTPTSQHLTWHPGSIRPYASLWHTVQRVAALNRLRMRELPDHLWCHPGEAANKASSTGLLFNEWRGHEGQGHGRVAVSTEVLASWLGEPADVFAWSHLGTLPPWSRQLVCSGLRLCRQCLAAGYHSALLSIRLLEACPIHGTELLSNCVCGRPFSGRISDAELSHAGHCACGRLSFFTRETCRQPLLPAAATMAYLPLVHWMETLSQVVRPRWESRAAQRADWQTWLGTLVQWGDELGIDRPACLTAPAPQRTRYAVHHQCGSHGGRLSQPARSSTAVQLENRYWRDEPGTWVYRAMQRYLRRHVARESGHWIRQFMASCDPIAIAQLMRSNRGALLAFGEMLWARTLEPGVSRRRWPYRMDATEDGRSLWGHLVLRGVEADKRLLQLSPGEWQWLQYQASGAVIAAAWRRSMAIAVQSARNGIADWSVDEHPDPLPENWSARQGPAGLHFVNLMQDQFVDWARPRPDKAARRAHQQVRADERRQAMQSACTGPCLSWSPREEWHVAASWAPANGVFRLHRLLGFADERPLFWLFEADGGFVARLRDLRLQAWAESPQAAIHALRTCLRRHRAAYGPAVPARKPAAVEPAVLCDATVQDAAEHCQDLVRQAKEHSRFWEAAPGLVLAARAWLGKQSRDASHLPREGTRLRAKD